MVRNQVQEKEDWKRFCTASNRIWIKHGFIQVSLLKDHGKSKNTVLTKKGYFRGKSHRYNTFPVFLSAFLTFK